MSMLEVIIATAITIVIALGISAMLVDMTRNRVEAEDKATMFSLQQQMSYDLKYKPLPPPTAL
jgi:Tfp pilus assembly protein PilV